MGESEMRPSWTYKLGQYIISIEKEEKHIDEIFGDTFRMLRYIQMAFHFLDIDIMRKIITMIIRP